MSNPTIKCLAHFDAEDSKDSRMNNPASFTKSSYIFSCFERLGYDVEILSASYTLSPKSVRGSTNRLSDKISLRTLWSLGRGCRLKNILGRIVFAINLLFRLLFFVKKGDVLWVYHSLGLTRYITFLKKIKDFKLILEVEEIYADVIGSKRALRREKAFFKYADAYIFCTDFLEKEINTDNKPFAIVHGTYEAEPYINTDSTDSKIHCVYAGTLDPRKGAHTAVKAAAYLGENYHIHILGYGSDSNIELIKKTVDEVNAKSKATVTYDGVLSGEEYKDFLRKCTIGLSTQSVDAEFNMTSFPSKVLVYMAHGLRVVSVRIPAIEKSDVGKYMYFYDESSPESVAEAIINIDLNDGYSGRDIIKMLDVSFMDELKCLLKS